MAGKHTRGGGLRSPGLQFALAGLRNREHE